MSASSEYEYIKVGNIFRFMFGNNTISQRKTAWIDILNAIYISETKENHSILTNIFTGNNMCNKHDNIMGMRLYNQLSEYLNKTENSNILIKTFILHTMDLYSCYLL